MSQIITIAQQKGGAGKSTLAANLSVYLASTGLKILMIDCDPQKSLSMWYDVRRINISKDNLTLVTVAPTDDITKVIHKYMDDHDFIILDTPPHASHPVKNIIDISDFVLIPTQLSPPDIWASQAILDIATQKNIPHLMILNRVPAMGRISRDLHQSLKDNNFPLAVTTLGNRNSFTASFLYGMGVTEVSLRANSAQEIIRLCEEIMTKLLNNAQANAV